MGARPETLETLERAAASLLLDAEQAPEHTRAEMLRIASELQALCTLPYFQGAEPVIGGGAPPPAQAPFDSK